MIMGQVKPASRRRQETNSGESRRSAGTQPNCGGGSRSQNAPPVRTPSQALSAPRTFDFILPGIPFELPPPGGQISLGRWGVGAGRVRGGGMELYRLDAWV